MHFEVREAVLGSDRGIMGKGVEVADSSRRAAKQTRSERCSGGSRGREALRRSLAQSLKTRQGEGGGGGGGGAKEVLKRKRAGQREEQTAEDREAGGARAERDL